MNIETPRTDKAVKESNGQWSYALVDTCKQLERELAAANQIMGELCESCGWAMRFPDQPCRCKLERELAEALEELKKANQYIATGRSWNAPDSLFAEISMLKQQRDTLAESLRQVRAICLDKSIETHPDEHAKGTIDDCIDIAESALAAVKGGCHY